MASTWLLIDTTFLCHRAYHSTGTLSHAGQSTGICFGVLRAVEDIQGLFNADLCVYGFDSAFSLREGVYPGYKSARRNREYTDAEKVARSEMYVEIDRLRVSVLPSTGCSNVFCVHGYEADDIVARVAHELPDGVDAVIVSADKDLLQCLNDRVIVYSPASKKVTTARSFTAQWGIHPTDWAVVKAIAGCSSDDVDGVPGVGDITAARWCAGVLNPESKAGRAIACAGDMIARNMPLVKLPYDGLVLPDIVPDTVCAAKLAKVKADLGIRSRYLPGGGLLRSRTPIGGGFSPE